MREILPATGTAPRLEERGKFRGWNLGLLLTAVLIAMTVLAFWRVLTAGFIDLDDPVYVTGNAHVLGGLTAGNMLWAWGVHAGYWIPLTWLSLMLDAQVYGVHAWGYHLTNLMLQCANVALLFAFLRRGTIVLLRAGGCRKMNYIKRIGSAFGGPWRLRHPGGQRSQDSSE